MIRDFKFFNDNEEEPLDEFIGDRYNGASWMYGLRENLVQYEYDIVEEGHYGIHSFLDNFPEGFVVTILSITGPNNRIHTHITNYDDGWGFDILRDRIIVEWVRFRNDNERVFTEYMDRMDDYFLGGITHQPTRVLNPTDMEYYNTDDMVFFDVTDIRYDHDGDPYKVMLYRHIENRNTIEGERIYNLHPMWNFPDVM